MVVYLHCKTITNNTNFKNTHYGNFNQLSSNSSSNNDNCEKRENKWSGQRN